MSSFDAVKSQLRQAPKTWLVTGVAGFIGSNLLEGLLKLDQRVVGLDNFSTGYRQNLEQVSELVQPAQWARFTMIEGTTCDYKTCHRACAGVDYILHQAALGSVPRSIDKPLDSHANNVTGFLNMLIAARDSGVKRFVYASSSAVYGDHPGIPSIEGATGRCLSPYAVTKCVNELYADVFAACYKLKSIGLRYFNVFGPRQDPEGAYAAVIPKWIAAMIKNEPVEIYGDGETSRDFCYVSNVVQANLLAALAAGPRTAPGSQPPLPTLGPRTVPVRSISGVESISTIDNAQPTSEPLRAGTARGPLEGAAPVCNIAAAERTTLNALFQMLKERLLPHYPHLKHYEPVYRDFRSGDIRHSLADISQARTLLGYEPTHRVADGLDEALEWYRAEKEL